MPAYLVGHIEITDRERFRDYQRAAIPAIKAAGGRILAAGTAELLEGKPFPNHNVVLEFPDVQAARRFYESAEYQAAIGIRAPVSTDGALAIVDGLPPR